MYILYCCPLLFLLRRFSWVFRDTYPIAMGDNAGRVRGLSGFYIERVRGM